MDDALAPHEREQLLHLDICQEVDRLRALGVRVAWSNDHDWEPDEVMFLTQYLDDGVWHLVIGRSATRTEQLLALERTWTILLNPTPVPWYIRPADPDNVLSFPLRRTALLRPVRCG